ncbi:MSMEG_0569 family flavin-dependent oxidoreductase [Methylophaga sp.]|uniref:MSMEG_0569 family flavin-dependent oxidoreductase n=1 Tax=Methylophaga sp. TaxID=2024840 RepID=UPI0027169D61|nr:MSMEG_0569 family flavin-dependent oxidoreductase [Methylophaga sp.]MDO8827467.1 MSMEG_0569 family flavin-dependent oxidoreductase [Methylophaga sp.]
MTKETINAHHSVIIVGGGQAGLSVSYYLQQAKIDHLVIEKDTMMSTWRDQRWDSFTLVTPNWQCNLPGHPYDGDDPKGFMNKQQIIDYLGRFAEKVNPPVIEHVAILKVTSDHSGKYKIETTAGCYTADQVVVASGGYRVPIIPRMAEKIPASVMQIHSEKYMNPQQLPDGATLVVGSGQSGAQIAEDIHLTGKKVYLATGDAPRVARFYRGKDVVEWLHDMKYYDISVDEHPLREGVRDNTNHYVTGRDGGREIDLRKFATQGMELFGLMQDFDGENLIFKPDLQANLEHADKVYLNINARIDKYIEENNINAPVEAPYKTVWQPETEREKLNLVQSGITSIIWCIGFSPDFSWLDAPVFNGKGHPQHTRGVTNKLGLYFIGLPWLYTWGSGRFSGIDRDAAYLVENIVDTQKKLQQQLELSA